ncbi:MAG: hypothetical protein KDJ96_13255, partial [Rhodobacteraceae bacterium]|nr:hypothetical protein [Paracoccaceae bacterium]
LGPFVTIHRSNVTILDVGAESGPQRLHTRAQVMPSYAVPTVIRFCRLASNSAISASIRRLRSSASAIRAVTAACFFASRARASVQATMYSPVS